MISPITPIVAFILTAATLPFLIPMLRRLKFGQSIREVGPSWHQSKSGIPTMGGLAFALGITGAIVATFVTNFDRLALITLLCGISFGFVGFADDYIKVVKKRNLGLTSRQKLILQILAGVAYIAAMGGSGLLSTDVAIPFINMSIDLGLLFYPFALVVIVGTVNAVNLTDGLDGLATCVSLPVAILFIAISLSLEASSLYTVAAALLGGLLGFIPFNIKPAKVFMGDTGSLFIGGIVAGLAFASGMPVILLICGGVYVLEALSVILQVGYFKATGGKRLFKMAPMHHHFEMSGFSENKVVITFSLTSVMLCILAWLGYTNFFGM